MTVVIDYAKKILDTAWGDYSNDCAACKKWILVWSGLAIIAGFLAIKFDGLYAIAEGLFIPALIAEIRQRGIISKDRSKLVTASANMITNAINQLAVLERLRKEKLSEGLEG